MPNMSYCRFENTYRDLRDCYENMEGKLSDSETSYRERLIELCAEILTECCDGYGLNEVNPDDIKLKSYVADPDYDDDEEDDDEEVIEPEDQSQGDVLGLDDERPEI